MSGMNRCGQTMPPPRPSGWRLKSRGPVCNRPEGHDGDHFEADRHTFQRLAVWPQGIEVKP